MQRFDQAALAAIILSAGALMPMPAAAQSSLALDWSDRSRLTAYVDEQRQLERDLLAVGKRAGYREFIAKRGFVITAVNEDSPHKLEFEVVKEDRSHEVLLGFDRENGPADAIDVTANIWLAEQTKRALSQPRWKPESVSYDPAAATQVRDSNHLAQWTAKQEALEKALPVGLTIDEYRQTLAEAGYRITATNEAMPTHAEYEIVNGDHSFELQIERDITTGRAVSVAVAANLWQAPETVKALKP